MGDHLHHSLLNPNQLRHHGVIVQDNPYASTSLHLSSHDDEFVMPMQTEGTTIFFNSTPTHYELAHCPHITLSSQAPWNPRDVQFPTATHHVEEGHPLHEIGCVHIVHSFDLSIPNDNQDITRTIAERLISEVRVGGEEIPDVPIPRTFTSDKRHTGVSAQDLSERW